jgi:hypothetical protein
VKPREGQEDFVGFALVCGGCAGLTDGALVRLMVEEHSDVLSRVAESPHRRHAVIGARIGEAGSLPRRHGLEECEDCRATVWIDREESDRTAPETPLYLCRSCALERAETGRMDAVPMFMTEGP